jgi:hypothetical protein
MSKFLQIGVTYYKNTGEYFKLPDGSVKEKTIKIFDKMFVKKTSVCKITGDFMNIQVFLEKDGETNTVVKNGVLIQLIEWCDIGDDWEKRLAFLGSSCGLVQKDKYTWSRKE